MVGISFGSKYNGFSSRENALAYGLISALPDLSASQTLMTAARASSAAKRRQGAAGVDNLALERKARLAQQRADNYSRLSAKLETTVRAVERSVEKLHEIRDILIEMRRHIVLAQNPDLSNSQRLRHANEFDRLLGQINIKTRSAGLVGANLIGNSIRDIFASDTITYRTKPDSPASQSVNGVYSASEYVIETSDGTLYFPDIYGSVLQRFPFSDDAEGLLVRDVDQVAFDPVTGAISITRPGEATPFLEGTVRRHGLGVLHSSFYGKFRDPAQLEQALADLDAAAAKLRFNTAVMEGQLGKVTAHRDYNANLIRQHRDMAQSVQTDKMLDQTKDALDDRRREILFAETFNSVLSFDRTGGVVALGLVSMFDFRV